MRFRLFLAGVICLFSAGTSLGGINRANPGFPNVTTVAPGQTFVNNNFSMLCMACHTRNPSPFVAGRDNNAEGTHFVYGVHDGISYQTQDVKKNQEKTSAWSSGGLSKYGNLVSRQSVTGAQGEIICESCHNVLVNNGNPYKLLETDNEALDPYPPPTVRLCEGCHARELLPGHHPLTGETSYVYGRPVTNNPSVNPGLRNPPLAGSQATYPTGPGVINCWSCHKPHRAQSVTGARLLKRGWSSGGGTAVQGSGYIANPVVNPAERNGRYGIERQFDKDPSGATRLVTDFTPLCDACHTASD